MGGISCGLLMQLCQRIVHLLFVTLYLVWKQEGDPVSTFRGKLYIK